MDEFKVVLETKENSEKDNKKSIFKDVFLGTLLIPIAGLAIAYIMKGQEVDAKNFELAIKILESQKKSDPEIKQWAKDTFYEYAKKKPSKEALNSLDKKPFIYDELKIKTDRVLISLDAYGNDKFQFSGINSRESSIVFNGLEVVNSQTETCYEHPLKLISFTPYTSFPIDTIDMASLKGCFTGNQIVESNSVLNIVPVDGNSLDSVKSIYKSVEKITLHVSWSEDSNFLGQGDSGKAQVSDKFIHKSYYLMGNKIIKAK